MYTMKRDEMVKALDTMKNGTIYSVTFIKKDGSTRLMNSIKGTRRGTVGGELPYDARSKGLIPVYDVQLAKSGVDPHKCWRMININTIKTFKVNNVSYDIVG
jgi:hypothetical protein